MFDITTSPEQLVTGVQSRAVLELRVYARYTLYTLLSFLLLDTSLAKLAS